MTIERFEDIEAWKKARQLTKLIYEFTDDGKFSSDYGLKNQVRRSAVSIMSNISEGFGRGGNKEFIQFLSIANGSVSELKSQLYIALDVGYLRRDQFEKLSNKAEEIGKLIGGFIRYLQKSVHKGPKFKKASS